MLQWSSPGLALLSLSERTAFSASSLQMPRDAGASMLWFLTSSIALSPPHRLKLNGQRVVEVGSSTDGKGAGSKSAGSTIGASDATGAGQAWSKEELDIHGTYKANLVVVVGELLPDVPNNSVKAFKRMSVFDFDHHSILPTLPNLPIVVRRLDDERTNLFLLQDKKDGLCKIAQLPLAGRDKIVWYSEWTAGDDATQAKTRQNIWRNNISSFCKSYQEEHQNNLLDVLKNDDVSLILKTNDVRPNPQD
ncbi:uncharacterized protein AUP68_03219 [Ilyonectria robusta]